MVAAHALAHLNALLNAAAAGLLVVGYLFIRRRRTAAHARTMLAAFVTSIAFLVSYLVYHFIVKQGAATPFPGRGALRHVYLTILATHTVLAAAVPFLAVITIYHGIRSGAVPSLCRFGTGIDATRRAAARRRHRRIARWTLPIWLYVSVTGVVVYLMLYHLYAARQTGSIISQ